MKIIKCLKHSFNMVLHSRLRSWLTIIGIVIGVAAVIAIMSLGQGMRQEMTNQLGNLGADLLTISAGYSRGFNMMVFRGRDSFGGGSSSQATTEEVVVGRADVQALKGIPDIKLIETEIRGTAEVTYLGKSGKVSLTGVDQKVWSQITTEEVKDGRMLGPADQNVIVIGSRLAESYFDQPIGINKMITIEGNAFRVVGILESSSTTIYMPIQMAYQVLEDKENGVYDSIIVKVKDEDKLNDTIAKIEQKLMNVRHVSEKTRDFSISSNQAMSQSRSEMMSSMNMFLLAIAGVSLIVGAVGVANTMFTSVLEKTKEIGIMKAIGARNKDILLIFLFNAALIGLIGGIIGIFFGTILSGALPALMGEVGFFRGGTLVSVNSMIIAISVSVGVGVLAGLIPAWKASRLKPVDALRYE